MATRRASQLAIGYSSVFLRQSAWDTPIDGTSLDRAFPATSRNYIDLDETTEDVDDCTGQDLLFEQEEEERKCRASVSTYDQTSEAVK